MEESPSCIRRWNNHSGTIFAKSQNPLALVALVHAMTDTSRGSEPGYYHETPKGRWSRDVDEDLEQLEVDFSN